MPSGPQEMRAVNQNAAPVRIPKLTYRNPLSESYNIAPNDGGFPSQEEDRAVSPRTSFSRTQEDAVRDDSSLMRPRTMSETPIYNGPRRSSASATLGYGELSATTSDTKRKKHSSLLGFFSLKEPSTSALEDFARQQQKQAAAKGGRATAVGMPGISSQKLPPTVPKVNSKWDGLPSPIRDKSRDVRSTKRDSAFTVASRTSQSSSSSSHMSSQASLSSGSSARITSTLVSSVSEIPEHGFIPTNKTFSSSHDRIHPGSKISASLPSTSACPLAEGSPEPRGSFSPMEDHCPVISPLQTFHPTVERHKLPSSRIPGVSDKGRLKEHDRPSTAQAEILPWEVHAPSPNTFVTERRESQKNRKLSFLSRKHA